MQSDRALAVVLVPLSTGYLAATFLIPQPAGQYAVVGPQAFPLAIAFGLLCASVFFVYLTLFETAGYLLATASFITIEARLLGSPSWRRNAMAGVGVTLGTAVGVLPGIGPALTISMLMPLTFGMDPVAAFIMFGGIYYGAMYGGSTTAILVRMPGEASSVVTALDGFHMTRQGRAGAALATAAIGSFVAGTFATVMLMLMAPMLVEVALGFGPAEYFALMLLALTAATGLSGQSRARGLLAVFLGLALGTIGIDLQTGQARFTFGAQGLLGGVDVVIVTVGLFAVGEKLCRH